MNRFLVYCISLLIFNEAQAQLSEKIETDRPDQTESPFTVPKKYFQGEFGFNAEHYQNGVKQFLHPTSLLKYGLSNRLELRVEANPFTMQEQRIPNAVSTTLLPPVEAGGKLRLWEEKRGRPKTSVIAMVSVPPVASKRFHNETATKTVRLTFQNSLTENISLGYNIGVEAADETSYLFTIAPGFELGENWYAYVEAFGEFGNGQSDNKLDAGVAYFFSKNTKIDLSAGAGLGNSLLKNYIALGFSFRIKTH